MCQHKYLNLNNISANATYHAFDRTEYNCFTMTDSQRPGINSNTHEKTPPPLKKKK